ncbi:hypothetical protein ES703_30164 [subsurface metagenome]
MINDYKQIGKNSIDINVWILGLLALVLLIPSTGQVQKYLGIYGVFVYLLLGTIAILVHYKYVWPVYFSKVTQRRAIWLAVITFLILIAVFTVVYPIANSGVVGGGSDRDEALNISVRELLRGKYPYSSKTYLDSPISPLPGSLLLSIPFVVLGNSAYQNIFWLIAFFVSVAWYFEDMRKALLLLWTILILSPVILQQFVTGGDLLSNCLYVLLFSWLTIVLVSKRGVSSWKKIVSSILLGIALSSRANFILIVPLVFSIILKEIGWKWTIISCALTFMSFSLVTVPFYLYEPESFSPLHTVNKLGIYQTVLPYSGVVIPIVSGILAIALSFQRMDFTKFLRNCTAVQALPFLSCIVLSTVQTGSLSFYFDGYGLFFLFFGVLSFWIILSKNVAIIPAGNRRNRGCVLKKQSRK